MDIFPTAYFGPITYYQQLVTSPQPTIEAKEHYIKQTIRNRCEILGPNDKQILTIPVERPNGNKTLVEDLKIVEDGWRKIHWKSIETAYASSAYFDYYGIEIKELLETKFERLIDFNQFIQQRILSWLDIDLETALTSTYIIEPANDFRKVVFDSASEKIHAPYTQVFRLKENCMSNLSILDLILNEGPMARNWIIERGRGKLLVK